MVINGKTLDLNQLGINFTPNDSQVNVIQELAKFLDKKDSRKTAVLAGSAGTGKTACTKIILGYLETLYGRDRYDVVLCAPTHKAKAVLKDLSGSSDVITVHKLLKLKPNIDILEFDAMDIEFLKGVLFEDDNDKIINSLIIIDEGSLLNDSVYDYTLDVLLNNGNKILFIGDHKQLKPVGQTEISKVFTSPDLKLFLTTVERVVKGSVLLDYLDVLRDQPLDHFEQNVNDISGVLSYSTGKDFMKTARQTFRDGIESKDYTYCKILAYTRKRVNQFNSAMLKALKFEHPLTVNCLYTGSGSFTSPFHITGENTAIGNRLKVPRADLDKYKIIPSIYDSADYVLVSKRFTTINIPYFQDDVPGYLIEMLDVVDEKIHCFYMIDPQLPAKFYDKLATAIECTRLRAVDKGTQYMKRKTFWAMWYKMNDSFTSMYPLTYEGRVIRKANFTFGYATTIHKSQGSTYTHSLIDVDTINVCVDTEVRRELQYVACSRAKSHIHVLQTQP